MRTEEEITKAIDQYADMVKKICFIPVSYTHLIPKHINQMEIFQMLETKSMLLGSIMQ